MNRCSECTHWKPLFTGESHGVRSFVDLPVEVQAEIRAKTAKQFQEDGFVSPDNALGDETTGVTDEAFQNAMDVPGGPDWPEWGDCALAEYGSMEAPHNPKSLARAMDGSKYMALLRCHATFGCVQWEWFDATIEGEAGKPASSQLSAP